MVDNNEAKPVEWDDARIEHATIVARGDYVVSDDDKGRALLWLVADDGTLEQVYGQ